MHTNDIERTEAQIRRVADTARELVDKADTIAEVGHDPSQSDDVLALQQELANELAQALADFNELANRAESVETDTITYEPTRGDLSIEEDTETSEVTITYTGDESVPSDEVTVYTNGTSVDVFGDGLTTDDTTTIDASDGDEISIEVVTHRQKDLHSLKPWSEIIGDENASAPEVSITELDLPAHDLIEDTRTIERTHEIGS